MSRAITRVVFAAGFLCAYTVGIRHAQAQGLGVARAGARCVAKDDAAILKECIDATPDQADAIDRLTDGAIQSLLAVQYDAERAERRRQLAQERAGAKEERESRVKALGQIERQWLDDVHLVLAANQADGWLRFEKARRRVALYGLYVTGRIEVPVAVTLSGADEDDNPALKAAIISWENEIDATAKEWIAQPEDPVSSQTPDGRKQIEKRRELLHSLAVANVRACRAVSEALSEPQRVRFAAIRLRAFAGGISPTLSRAAVTREVLSIPGLPEPKREQVRRIVAEHQAKVQEIGADFLKRADEALLTDATEGSLPTLTEQAIAKSNQVELSLEDSLLAILDEAEKLEYRKVPPVPYVWRGTEDNGWRYGGPLDEEK